MFLNPGGKGGGHRGGINFLSVGIVLKFEFLGTGQHFVYGTLAGSVGEK